jgi:hypothetical protein
LRLDFFSSFFAMLFWPPKGLKEVVEYGMMVILAIIASANPARNHLCQSI